MFSLKTAVTLVAGALLAPCVGGPGPSAWAQPPVAGAPAAPADRALQSATEPQVKAGWAKLQKDTAELEATDPRAAIARYQGFFEAGAFRFPSVGLPLSLRIARLYQIDLKNYDKAIEIYDWALGLYKNQPDAILLQRGRLAAVEAQNRAEGAPPNGGLQPSTAGGAAPWAVVPKAAATGQLGVNLSPPTNGAGLGITLPTAIAKPGGLGITLPAAPNQNAMAVTPSLPPGRALGWQPGRQRCVTALTQQGGGIVWVATEDSGVWRYDPAAPALKRWRQFTAQDGLGDNSAYALAVDKAGRVWAGTLNHGVSVWNGEEWKNYGVLDGPLGERVFDIAVCPTDGDVWIATNAGLTRYSMKGDSWSYVTRADGLPSDQIEAIAFDKSGNIVLGTQCDGVALAQAADGYKTWRVVQGPQQMPLTATGEGLPSNLINDVLVARDGTIYAATTTGLAWSSDGGTKWAYARGEDYADKVRGLYGGAPAGWKEGPGAVLAEDYVSCLAEDEAGHVWIGHWKEGSEMVGMQNGPAGLGVKEVSYRKESGFIKAMLPRDKGALLLARYDEGLSYGSATTEKNDEAPTAAVKPKTGAVDLTVTLPVAATAAIEPKTIVVNTMAALPTAAKTPTLEDLRQLRLRVAQTAPNLEVGQAYFMGQDWQTQGDWVGRYGRRKAVLCAVQAPFDAEFVAKSPFVPVIGELGPHYENNDSIRRWIHYLKTDDRRTLLGYRRQAEWDDHGETYPLTFEGPDLWATIEVPAGTHRLTSYFFNKDGHRDLNRERDYSLELRLAKGPIPPWPAPADGEEVTGEWLQTKFGAYYSAREKLIAAQMKTPPLAQARVRDFWGGVHAQFLVQGPATYWLKVGRNYSFNSIVSSVMLDEIGPDSNWSNDVQGVTFGGRYNPPDPDAIEPIDPHLLDKILAGTYQAPIEPTDADKIKIAVVAEARALWDTTDASLNQQGGVNMNWQARVMAYRAAAANNAPAKLLENWRWKMPLWTTTDRLQWKSDMTSNYNYFIKLNPEFKNADF